ncbi:MAG: hypothetical protein V4671_09665 [Armatimonadota bacterium]
MIYGQELVSSREVTENAAPVVSDEEMAGIVKAASTRRVEAHTADLADLADSVDTAESISYPAPRVRDEVREPKGRD